LKLGLTRFSVSGSAIQFIAMLAVAVLLSPMNVSAQAGRRNELTLGGLQPGKDSIEQAKARFKDGQNGKNPIPDPLIWESSSSPADTQLRFEANAQHIIDGIVALRPRMLLASDRQPTGGALRPKTQRAALRTTGARWKTGLGLGLGDSCKKAVKLYGTPDSRSPSTKGGQPLQLLYYAFDWAGPDVPQVMQVVCTPEKDGQPGRVVEITLAASSL